MGAAAASLFPAHPYAAFAAGFASHLAIDALPHWDYTGSLRSIHKNTARPLDTSLEIGTYFTRDTALVAADAFLGAALTMRIFVDFLNVPLPIAFIGAGAGLFPDFLSAVYMKTKWHVLEPLQQFHIWIQKGKSLEVEPWVGIALQCAMVAVVVALLRIVV